MTSPQVLITGGAGFIGAHLTQELLDHGYSVRILDNLTPQVHGTKRVRPDYLSREAELIVGDVRDAAAVRKALRGVDVVYHLAARVGVGQSMYEIAEYTSVNNFGTSVLLEQLIERPVRRLIVASSMSVYGEGLYRRADGSLIEKAERSTDQLKAGSWELRDGSGSELAPVPTPESKSPCLTSVYALSKFDQERMCLMIGRAYGIPTVALRFFNAYGPYQALSNPYTGVLAIFSSRVLNDKPPLLNEDGRQTRDFVNVTDIARACRLALERDTAVDQVINVASGQPVTIAEVAARLSKVLGKRHLALEITNRYRAGDIRHCYADISHARAVLGYAPRVSFDAGLHTLAGWLERQVTFDRVDQSRAELEIRGLMV
ncbi:MAG: NAD-dependent epimerase/dehydratase family protein [Acidobacteriia bacterium]|nr:NAD-dependent epimerase/dehydratase family protein [Terriglobia bacterium]